MWTGIQHPHGIAMKGTKYRLAKLINIGFGNVVNTQKIVAVVNPEAAPIKRMIQNMKQDEHLVDATQGRKTKAVIITDEHVILSALQPETISKRFADNGETEEE